MLTFFCVRRVWPSDGVGVWEGEEGGGSSVEGQPSATSSFSFSGDGGCDARAEVGAGNFLPILQRKEKLRVSSSFPPLSTPSPGKEGGGLVWFSRVWHVGSTCHEKIMIP